MIEYELEQLKWKKRQIGLQKKYTDTPPGITKRQAEEAEESLAKEWMEYEAHHRFRLEERLQITEEPFVGREKELEELRSLFGQGAGMVVLSGMGGIGKSALARAYGRIYREHYDKILWWDYENNLERIFADDGQLAISNLAYSQNKYLSRRKYARVKYEKLAKIAEAERLLIILDNYNEMEDVWFSSLLEIRCDLLITTRLRSSLLGAKGYAHLTVEPLSQEKDWKAFCRLYTGREPEEEEWKRIADYRDSVKGHTLKMKLALSDPDRKWTTEQFAKSLLSHFRLKKSQIQVLCELSYITLLGIPEEVYLSCTEEKQETVDSLKNWSLIQERKETSGQTFLSLHPVIAEAVRVTWQPGLSRCLKFVENFAWYARFSWYRPREGDLWLVNQVFTLVEHLPKPVAWRYYLYECLATFFMEWEFFAEAEKIQLELYDCVSGYYGENHQFTAYMSFRIAGLYHDSMQFDKDKEWYLRSLRQYEGAKPVTRIFYHDKADAAAKLERIYEYEENYEDAHRCIDVAMEAMKQFRKETEKEDPGLWELRRNCLQYIHMRRASIYLKQGYPGKAQQELDIGLHMFPLDEFREVEIRRLQSLIYLAQGDYEKARETAQKDLEICVRYQGESYKMSMTVREGLGDIYRAMGDAQAANEEYLRIMSVLQEKYPHQTGWMERLRKKIKM